uniref:DRBM domain-containing protein n=1 Tax=Otolemur garnettii TaxID=30611 RepID=H0XZI2_OTOGA
NETWKKTMYKPVEPYSQMQSTCNYNLRAGAYPPRYVYPFPVPPLVYQVELSMGGQQVKGKGKTREATNAMLLLKRSAEQNEPPPEGLEVNGQNLPVNVDMAQESAPLPPKNFVTKVLVEESTGGKGNSKKTSQRNTAIAVLEELKELPPLLAARVKPMIKKKKNAITKPKPQTGPAYGWGINLIKLAQIQQTKKEEPQYMLLTGRGLSHRESVMQLKLGNQAGEGSSTSKKVAKLNAAKNIEEIFGSKVQQAQPTKPRLKSEEKIPIKKPGNGRKPFFEPSSGDENETNKKENEFRISYLSHQQLSAGILPMVPVAQSMGVNQEPHANDFTRVAPNLTKATVTAMIAMIAGKLYGGTLPTAKTILKNNISLGHVPQGPLTHPLSNCPRVQGFQVEYKDFPQNKNKFVSCINCSSQPSLILHGIGNNVESFHNMAALNILKLLPELDQQSTEMPTTGNGQVSVCGRC